MATVNTLVHAFNVGEVSSAALARVDNERLRLAAEVQENLYPHVIGKGQVRPGGEYLGNTASDAKGRLIQFIRETDDVALLEFTDSLLRVWADGDTLVTRPTANSTVTNGDFSSSAGWTLTASSGASAAISGGVLTMAATARGASAYCERSVTTSSAGTEHALRIIVTKGPVLFRCGSASGDDDYIASTSLDTGTHSLAFVPSGTYYVRFTTRSERQCQVDSITVEAAGVMTLPAPWSLAQLPLIRYAQSADVVFLACASWQQRKIERRGSGASAGRSWSITLYEANDGPFQSGATESNVLVTPGAAFGNTTLTAASAIFKSTDVGSVFKLFTYGQGASFDLAGADQYTQPVRLTGVGTDNDFSVVLSGVWVGTLYLQRSYDGPDTGFIDTGTTYIANGTTAGVPGTEYDNVICWYRVGFKAGTYTSGVCTAQFVTNSGGGTGVFRITAYSSATSVSAEVLVYPTSIAASANWAKAAWSDYVGWPSAVTFFDGRLWWGGKDKFWSSQSDSYYKFSLVDNTSDSGSIQRSIATGGQINTISWMLPLQRLLFGTSGAEVSARSSSFDEPLTPNNITIKDASTQGVAPISAVKLDSRGIYVHRDGRHMYEIVYDFEANDYRATRLTNYNEDIAGDDGFTEIAIQRSPENYIWGVRADGMAAVMLYDVKEKAAAWFKHIAAPSVAAAAVIESVAVLPGDGQDRVYMLVKRTINGSTVRFLERLAKHSEARGATNNYMADAFKTFAGPSSSVTVAHLAGETGLVAWATTGGAQVVLAGLSANGSGVVSLGGTYTNITIGLAYSWRYKSSKLAYGAANGTSLLMTKRVDRIGLLTQYEHPDAIYYGRDFTNIHKRPRIEKGRAVGTTVRTSLDTETFPLGDKGGSWDTDSRVCLVGTSPYPATILAMVIDIETNEDRSK